MKNKMKSRKNAVECTIYKRWKRIMSVVKQILRTNIQVSEELSKIDKYFHQIILPVTRKNQSLLKIKNSIK